MEDGAYERDILTWAERQAGLLRQLARGERVSEAVDWPHVIEEVEDLGLAELRACESLFRQALVHLVKLHQWPDGPAAHWRGELAAFLADAQARFTPSMRQRIELEKLYRKALKQVTAERIAATSNRVLPSVCPVTLDDLLAEELDVDALLRRFG